MAKTTDRKAQLVRAAKARAAITALLHAQLNPLPQRDILPHVQGYTSTSLTGLLDRMAGSGLIQKVAVEHPDYHFVYTSAQADAPTAPKERKVRVSKQAQGISDIDVRVNEKTGGLTVTYAGLRITFNKEN